MAGYRLAMCYVSTLYTRRLILSTMSSNCALVMRFQFSKQIIVGAQIQQMLFMHFNGIYFCFGLFPRGSMLPLVIAKMGHDSVCHVFLAPSPTHLNST